MDAKDYKVRCDKCQFKPYVYCEMCMIRTKLQDAIEENRKTVERACASMQIALNEIHDILLSRRKKRWIVTLADYVRTKLKNLRSAWTL